MQFTDVFIRRPVFASALNLMLLVSGIAAFLSLPVRQFPLIETNVVTVSTTYPGASAELMAGFVSTPLENSIGSIDGIDYMTSTNMQNVSQITVNLQLGYPIESGVVDTSNQVSAVRYMLPKQIQDPVISKQDPNANPTVYISFSSTSISEEAVTDYLLRVVQPQLETLNGVSQAAILGEREYAMRLNLDSDKMTAFNVTPNDVMAALRQENLQAAVGQIQGEQQQYNLTASSDLATVSQFENLVITQSDDYIVRMSDIAEVVLGSESYNSSAVMNGKTTTVIGIIPTTDANPLAVSQLVDDMMPSIQKQLPSDIKAEIVYDSSVFISASIDSVYETMVDAAIFVLIVIFLFLGSFRAVIIPMVTIPLSLIGVCGIMLALNFTINTITLLAWVLAIGLVVDDAIVVLENIHRHMEEGLSAIPSAIIGAREIGFAVIAMTITLAAVYAPIGFTGGLTGILFSEFAFTLAASVVISGFVALTLSPMMCSRILTYDPNAKGFAHYIDIVFEKIQHHYKKLLAHVLKARWLVFWLSLASYGLLAYMFITTPQELAPTEDQGVVIVYVTGPTSSNIKFTENYTNEMIPIFEAVPEMLSYGIINGFPSSVNTAVAFLNLIPWDERARSAMDIQTAIFPQLWSITGLKAIPVTPPPLPVPGSMMPVEFVLKNVDGSKQGILRLNSAMHELMKVANENPGFMGMETDIKLNMPQVNVQINRDKAGDLGISVQEISSALNVALGTPEDVQFAMMGRGYYVIPQLKNNFDFKGNPDDINNVYVRTRSQDLVPLSNLVTLENQVAPQTLNHFQQLPSATLYANLAPNYPLGEALKFLSSYAEQNFPDLQVDYGGQARQFIEVGNVMLVVMGFAVIIIFLVLAAQFESYRDPIIVLLFVIPLTLTGAMIVLRISGGTSNIYSQVGLVTLIGLISKHGILIVEFANQLQLKGMSKIDAAIASAGLRLRPILMTTAAMVLGAFPLAVATGAGAAANNQMGIVIVGGMIIGTFFSLFIVPCIYSIVAKVKVHDEKLEQEIADAIALSEKKVAEEEAQRKGRGSAAPESS